MYMLHELLLFNFFLMVNEGAVQEFENLEGEVLVYFGW